MDHSLRLSQLPDRFTVADFWTTVGEMEHERLEFKSKPARLTDVLPAMAMSEGGWVILGVDDARNVLGCPLNQETLDRVTEAAKACGVEVQLREITVGIHRVTVIAVPEVRGRIVTTPDGRLLRRTGAANHPLVGDALARFVRERQDTPAEDDSLPVVDLEDFDLDLVNRALEADDRPRVKRPELLRALSDLQVVRHEAAAEPLITKAAALLFARDPRKYVAGACIQVVRRVGVGPGPGPTQARKEITGPLRRALDDTLAFIAKHTERYEAVVGKHREVFGEYPTAVLREAVLNAVAHRDYGLQGATVDVTIWDDRIEVRSPGPLPGHITLLNIRQEHYSRNRRTMRVLKLLGLVEEYGEGVDRMFREMEARLMEPPSFAVTPSSVTVTLRNRSLLSVEDQAWLSLLGHLDLSPSERRVLVLARREGDITPRRLRELMPDADVDSLLSGAVAKGLLVLTGRRGGAKYVLSDEVVLRAGAEGLEARNRQRQLLLDEIRKRGSLSTAEAATHFRLDRGLVRHLLNDLVRIKLASATGRTRGRRYYPI
ncbi:MAG: ATP-binding protein [Gemmatimonadota bacterium]|jgi:ATP-dependent DNA helicase RecG